MTQVSPAKIKVTGINQIALVVKDLQKTMENYWSILGIGPWEVYDWEAPLVHHRKYHGKPSWGREKIATAKVGAAELELCQPIDGDCIYRDFLMEHGEGLHHINFLTDTFDDVDKTAEILVNEGFPCIQSGHFGPSKDPGAFSYIDIKPLHTIWEPDYESQSVAAAFTRYPDTAQKSPAKVKVTNINQVALVVKDLQKTMENYWKILGIGPWEVYDWEAPLVHHRKYHGKPSWGREKIALTRVGAVELELCQPVDGDSIYQDFLTEHGEGLHHMNFRVDDVFGIEETLAEQGFPSLQSAYCSPMKYNGNFSYIDTTKSLRTIWELTNENEAATKWFEDNVKATRYPEDSAQSLSYKYS